MIIETAAFFKTIFIFINRIISWFGSGYFIKQGIKKKRKRYFLVAMAVSFAMFVLLMIFLDGPRFPIHLAHKVVGWFN